MVYVFYRMTSAVRYEELHAEAYTLLSDAMRHCYGVDTTDYAFMKEPNGKPYLENFPYQFSISHTKGLVAVAVSTVAVGIDIEPSDRVVGQGVAKRFLGKSSATVSDWTRYESVGKLFGCGIPFSRSEIQSPYYTKLYTDIPGYTLCCSSLEDAFFEKTVLL